MADLGPRDISLQEVIAFLTGRGAQPTNENVNRVRESGVATGPPTNLLEGHNAAMDLLGESIPSGNPAPLTPVNIQELGPAPTDPFANARPGNKPAPPSPTGTELDKGQASVVGSPALDALIASLLAGGGARALSGGPSTRTGVAGNPVIEALTERTRLPAFTPPALAQARVRPPSGPRPSGTTPRVASGIQPPQGQLEAPTPRSQVTNESPGTRQSPPQKKIAPPTSVSEGEDAVLETLRKGDESIVDTPPVSENVRATGLGQEGRIDFLETPEGRVNVVEIVSSDGSTKTVDADGRVFNPQTGRPTGETIDLDRELTAVGQRNPEAARRAQRLVAALRAAL